MPEEERAQAFVSENGVEFIVYGIGLGGEGRQYSAEELAAIERDCEESTRPSNYHGPTINGIGIGGMGEYDPQIHESAVVLEGRVLGFGRVSDSNGIRGTGLGGEGRYYQGRQIPSTQPIERIVEGVEFDPVMHKSSVLSEGRILGYGARE